MADMDEVLKLCPGTKKMNLHASYAIFQEAKWADRDKLVHKHFAPWVQFCKVPEDGAWLPEVIKYRQEVLSCRN